MRSHCITGSGCLHLGMRKLHFILIILLLSIACEKREAAPVETPDWLQPRIEELEATGCDGCSIIRYTYKEEFFYQVLCNSWSCIDCELYHYNGDPVVWGEYMNHADFDQNKDRPIKIWECLADSVTP